MRPVNTAYTDTVVRHIMRQRPELFETPFLDEPEEGVDCITKVMCEVTVVGDSRIWAYLPEDESLEDFSVYDHKIHWEDLDVMHVEKLKQDRIVTDMSGKPFNMEAWLVKKNQELIELALREGVTIPPWCFVYDEQQTRMEDWGVC